MRDDKKFLRIVLLQEIFLKNASFVDIREFFGESNKLIYFLPSKNEKNVAAIYLNPSKKEFLILCESTVYT